MRSSSLRFSRRSALFRVSMLSVRRALRAPFA
jgi:hypothetical protein